MQPTASIWSEINEAFRLWMSGDARSARARFEALIAAAWVHPYLDLGLAYSCRDSGDLDGALAAAERLLAAEPMNPLAMIIKADVIAARGDERAAVSLYANAARVTPPGDLAPMLRAELSRAAAAVETYAGRAAGWMDRQLEEAGVLAEASPRFLQSLAIARRERRVYQQRPIRYFFPGLPLIEFYERRDFPWTAMLEASAGTIREEAERVLSDPQRLTPYVADDGAPGSGPGDLTGSRQWTAFFLWQSGQVVEENARLCPRTMDVLRELPLAHVPGATPSVLFSVLAPGAHIPPHNGMLNTRLICHLPLITPPGCSLRVGGETREWRYGETLIFDDSIEHEAWNRSDQTRVVLLFDVWRPELTDVERRAVAAYLTAQARFEQQPPPP